MNLKKYSFKRVAFMLLGNLVVGIGVAMLNVANLGIDPFTGVNIGLSSTLGISLGVFELGFNFVVMLIAFKYSRSLINVGTFINLATIGFIIEYSSLWLGQGIAVIGDKTLLMSAILMVLGLCTICFAAALLFVCDLGVAGYDCMAYILEERTGRTYGQCRIFTDGLCVIVGFSFGATIGIGTVLTAFCMGPLIDFFRDKVIRPYLFKETLA